MGVGQNPCTSVNVPKAPNMIKHGPNQNIGCFFPHSQMTPQNNSSWNFFKFEASYQSRSYRSISFIKAMPARPSCRTRRRFWAFGSTTLRSHPSSQVLFVRCLQLDWVSNIGLTLRHMEIPTTQTHVSHRFPLFQAFCS